VPRLFESLRLLTDIPRARGSHDARIAPSAAWGNGESASATRVAVHSASVNSRLVAPRGVA